MTADADYARAVEQLSKATLTPYVSYVQHFTLNGMGRNASTDRVVIRVRDGKVIEGTTFSYNSQSGSHIADAVDHPIFDPSCYRPTNEAQATFDGKPAVKFDLASICRDEHSGDHDNAFTTLYVQPGTLRPLDASGNVASDDDSKNVAVSLDQRFGDFDGHVLPSAMRVDVSGSGWMFWLQVHVRQEFSDYQFLQTPPASK